MYETVQNFSTTDSQQQNTTKSCWKCFKWSFWNNFIEQTYSYCYNSIKTFGIEHNHSTTLWCVHITILLFYSGKRKPFCNIKLRVRLHWTFFVLNNRFCFIVFRMEILIKIYLFGVYFLKESQKKIKHWNYFVLIIAQTLGVT